MGPNVERTLSFYSKEDERLAGEYRLAGIEVDELRALFGVPAEDPMYEVYPVGPVQAVALQRFVGEPIDLGRYDYFVECHAEPSMATSGLGASRAADGRPPEHG